MPRDWSEAYYSRIYTTIVDDPKFADVYYDDRRLAAYVRLLMAADAAYPAPASLPRWIELDVLEHLVMKRIVEPVHGHAYRIVALRAEREGRDGGRRAGGLARIATAQRDARGRIVKPSAETLLDPATSDTPATMLDPMLGLLDDAGKDAGPATNPAPPGPASPANTIRVDTSSPLPPAERGVGSPRANGTSPRQVAATVGAADQQTANGKAYRRQQRQLAVYRGAITDVELVEMNRTDAPLTDIPDWSAHQDKLRADAAATVDRL